VHSKHTHTHIRISSISVNVSFQSRRVNIEENSILSFSSKNKRLYLFARSTSKSCLFFRPTRHVVSSKHPHDSYGQFKYQVRFVNTQLAAIVYLRILFRRGRVHVYCNIRRVSDRQHRTRLCFRARRKQRTSKTEVDGHVPLSVQRPEFERATYMPGVYYSPAEC